MTAATLNMCVGYTALFKGIQLIVVSQAGDTIIVAAGTYREQLTISKALTINGNDRGCA